MTRETYRLIESFMLDHMDPDDTAHGPEHVYRVLYAALDIAAHEENVDRDALICACLLHDVGRRAQAEDPSVCHAAAGAEMARTFLLEQGFGEAFANHVADCILAHRYRTGVPCATIEAKILFDSDKLDVSGALGVARTLHYGAQYAEPIYARGDDGEILDGSEKAGPRSFLREYHYKLKKVYDSFHTARAAEIAAERRRAAEAFYDAILSESREAEHLGRSLLRLEGE